MTSPMTRNKPAEIVGGEGAALQWANSKTMARATRTDRWLPLVGFHIEVGRDADVDMAMAAANTPQWEIKHQRAASAEIKAHWYLGETIKFYPFTAGPTATTVTGCIKDAQGSIDAGLGVRWPQGEKSRFAVRGYLDILLGQRCAALVTLGVRSKMTERLHAALLDHCRVAEAADALIDRAKHPDLVCLHELALPLGAGDEEDWGKAESATVVPLRSMHPAEIDAAYIRTIWRSKTLAPERIEEDWSETLAWAAQYAAGSEQRSID